MTLRHRFELLLNGLLVLCAVLVTVMLARREFFTPAAAAEDLNPVHLDSWRQYAVGDMRLGPPSADVTITEFSDFECPFCGRLYRSLEHARAQHPGRIALVYRNYPLTQIHPGAGPAAVAAECAAAQGAFPALYAFAFEHQAELPTLDWRSTTDRLGIADSTEFARCLADPRTGDKLRTDSLAAARLDIPGTPLVLVNGWMFRGAPSETVLDSTIAQEVAASNRQPPN